MGSGVAGAEDGVGEVQHARDVGDPAEMIEAYQVLADYAASAVAPAEAEYQTVRLVFERLCDESRHR
jgi:hypothetical protein